MLKRPPITPRLSLVNLLSGVERPMGADVGTPKRDGSMVWPPDSRWLFVVTEAGRVAAVDPNTGRVGNLGVRLPRIEQLAIRAAPNAASSAAPTPSPTTRGAATSACRHPDAIVSTSHPVPVGQPAAPSIGPLSFHPYPYAPGTPTKMIINAEHNLVRPAVMRGFRCSDRRVLRSLFSRGADTLPNPPYSEHQMTTDLGGPLVELAAMPVGGNLGGYALFSSPGQWAIILTENETTVGLLRIDVTTAATR
jgi:hypothetical protein